MGSLKEVKKIEGVATQPLKEITDSLGSVLHMLRNDSPLFNKFGEIYFSEINPKTIKAWKLHKKITQNIAVPVGRIRLVIYDNRPESSTHRNIAEYQTGRHDNFCLIHIPPMLWYGFQSLDSQKSLIVNCTDLPHDPLESRLLPLDSGKIPFQWGSTK
jgi:dTDP-4-dehydrorhamnose 3,5-epimerase